MSCVLRLLPFSSPLPFASASPPARDRELDSVVAATLLLLAAAALVFIGPFAGDEHPPHQVCPAPSKTEHPNPI